MPPSQRSNFAKRPPVLVQRANRPQPLATPGASVARAHSMGDVAPPAPALMPGGPAHPNYQPGPETWPQFAGYVKLPAFYTATGDLGPAVEDTYAGSIRLRPEYFVLKRITFATYADLDATSPLFMSSPQARCVECSWSDEFTKFLGSQPALVATLFGDSNGFLDLLGGILFQGSQTLTINLRRVFAFGDLDLTARWDFNFQGIMLLPPGQQSSGSMT